MTDPAELIDRARLAKELEIQLLALISRHPAMQKPATVLMALGEVFFETAYHLCDHDIEQIRLRVSRMIDIFAEYKRDEALLNTMAEGGAKGGGNGAATHYVAQPLHPWWDESLTGPAPQCQRCGCWMVRPPPPDVARILSLHSAPAAPGWLCLSCEFFIPDPPDPAPAVQ
jgi:hypothetical protein